MKTLLMVIGATLSYLYLTGKHRRREDIADLNCRIFRRIKEEESNKRFEAEQLLEAAMKTITEKDWMMDFMEMLEKQ